MTTPEKHHEANTPDAPERAHLPGWFTLVSGGWVFFGLGLWAAKSYNCDGKTWIQTAAACSELNEFGDFLAGIFAPLAFIWLAGAVFIQSKELSAQRHELALTREELKLNRKVASEQAEAARRSADTFEQQTRYSDTERRLREQEATDRDLQALITPVRALHQRIQPPSRHVQEMTDIAYALHFGSDFGGRLAIRLEQLRAEATERALSSGDSKDLQTILGCAAIAAQLPSKASNTTRFLFSLLGLDQLQAAHHFDD